MTNGFNTNDQRQEPRQLQIDWSSATKRRLLTRLSTALQGMTLGDLDRPKERIRGSTVDLVMQGLHGWCIKEGWTDRTPAEICPSLGEQTVRRVLAYLQSESTESCVASESFRYRNSPRVRRSICWPNLEAWCEQLEAEKTEVSRSPIPQKHPLAAVGSPSRSEHVTLSHREGHPLGARGSYKEDGPNNGPDGPHHGATKLLSETEADLVDEVTGGGMDGNFRTRVLPHKHFTTEARRHGEPESINSGLVRNGMTPDKMERLTYGGRAPCSRSESTSGSTPSAGVPADATPRLPAMPPCLRGEIEAILKDQLGVEAARACVDIALRTQSIEQVAAIVRFAAGQTVNGVAAWGPGFVFARVSRAPSDSEGPEEGWAKRRPEWILAKGRDADRKRQERAAARQRAERDLRTRPAEMEAFWGPLIDRLYRENKLKLLASLTKSERTEIQARGGTFTSRGVRDLFLLAAIEGRFSE